MSRLSHRRSTRRSYSCFSCSSVCTLVIFWEGHVGVGQSCWALLTFRQRFYWSRVSFAQFVAKQLVGLGSVWTEFCLDWVSFGQLFGYESLLNRIQSGLHQHGIELCLARVSVGQSFVVTAMLCWVVIESSPTVFLFSFSCPMKASICYSSSRDED